MLKVIDLSKNFGGIKAIQNVSFEIRKGELVGLIGPNGSGKTTLFNLITGIVKPDSGRIIFEKSEINQLSIEERAKLGISRTFQGLRLLENLTVLENVVISVLANQNYDRAKKKAEEILFELGLKNKINSSVRSLNLFEKKLVELGRALAPRPKFLLLDEIMAGLNELEQESLGNILIRLNKEEGITIFWIEHILRAMIKLVRVDRILVLEWGKMIAEGKPEEILKRDEVVEAYMGRKSFRGVGNVAGNL
ncbi:MAG: ABC transporter ATP-binding protein [Candidatus Aenigmatarchaeota archaeon]